MTDRYRATVVRADGKEEDWGFYDLLIHDSGTLAIRDTEEMPNGGYNNFIAAGQWIEVQDIRKEED